MDYQSNEFEKRAMLQVNKLKQEYVIDVITSERIQEILVYLYLSKVSRNQRGINIQTEKLKNVLHNCPKTMTPVFSAHSKQSVYVG
jgi:aspartate carbamoyltransferase regulatory subunit